MSDNATSPETAGADAGTPNGQQAAQPSLNSLAQYVKDLSFENPRAPQSLQANQKQPEIDISVNVNAQPLNDNDFEVILKLDASAKTDGEILFSVELAYAGVFRITGLEKDKLHPVIFIECPRLLFPFARQIVAEATRNGGFPPLMVDPVDFMSLYRQQVARMRSSQDAGDDQPGQATDA
ncbi:MAG: protein-export chaperone SecB [Pseudomonadota bacterium]